MVLFPPPVGSIAYLLLNYGGTLSDEFNEILTADQIFPGLITGAAFYAELLTSLAAAGFTPSYSAASADRLVPDHTGALRRVNAAEARFWGARHVENLAPALDTWTSAELTGGQVLTQDANLCTVSVPSGGRAWINLAFTGSVNTRYMVSAKVTGMNAEFNEVTTNNFSIVDFQGYGGGSVYNTTHQDIYSSRDDDGAAYVCEYVDTGADAVGVIRIGIGVNNVTAGQSAAAVCSFSEVMLEEIPYDYTGAPSDWIDPAADNLVSSAGAVLGVRNYRTTNGNTVGASGVVTKGAGAVITTAQGLLAEPLDDPAWDWNDHSVSTWTPTRLTVQADWNVAPDGRKTADLVSETADTGTHLVAKGSTVPHTAGATCTASTYLKPNAAMIAAARRIRLAVTWTPNSIIIDYDTVTQTIVNTVAVGTATIADYGVIPADDRGFVRIFVIGDDGAAAVAPVLTVQVLTSAGATSFTGDTANGVYQWGAKISEGDALSSFYEGTRAADTGLTYGSIASIIDGEEFSAQAFMRRTPSFTPTLNPNGGNLAVNMAGGGGSSSLFYYNANPRQTITYNGSESTVAVVSATDWDYFASEIRMRMSYSKSAGAAYMAVLIDEVMTSDATPGVAALTMPVSTLLMLANLSYPALLRGVSLYASPRSQSWVEALA